jgi:TolB-like protein/DNA-binding winged helix-turn-helix (wHTH) protein/Tfp pilus assembly protein PilF
MSKPTKQIYEFGPFRLDTAERLLLRSGETVPLTPKAFDTLVVLVQKSGHVVGKDELMNEVWADSFVEESNLTQNIFVLRKVLGEDGSGRLYIETVPKRGYRFVASVREVMDDNDDLATEKRAGPLILPKAIALDDVLNSIAVLPLTNVSANPDAEYLSDGITESIINSLSQLPQLRVMARSTVFRYKGKEFDPQEVGQGLGVRAVLVGRVLQQRDSLIVRTELVDVANGWQLWGEQYNRKLADILGLQEDIAREISEKLRIKLTGEEKKRLAKRYTDDSEAYRLYLKGRYYWNKYTKEGLTKAIEYFDRAIELDPSYALAYTGLADSYYRLSNAYLPPKETLPKARKSAMKALEIDDTLAEAHASLGLIKLYHDWDLSGAEREYKRAIDLDPRSPLGYHRYGSCVQLTGRFDESLASFKRALELDPLSLLVNSLFAISLYVSRQYDKSIEHYRKTLDMDPNYLQARFGIGLPYEQKGMYEEAIAAFQQARVLSDDVGSEALASLGCAYAASGQIQEAENVLADLQKRSREGYVSPYIIARIYVGLGEKDIAFEWLERAYEERSEWLTWLQVDPRLDRIRSDARFQNLMQRVGFEPL